MSSILRSLLVYAQPRDDENHDTTHLSPDGRFSVVVHEINVNVLNDTIRAPQCVPG